MEEYVTDFAHPIPLERGFLTDLNNSYAVDVDPTVMGNDTGAEPCLVAELLAMSSKNATHEAIHILEEMKFYIKGYVNPGVCMFGIVGNMFNLLVLTRRRIQCTMDCSMERAAHLGLITLAISDMLYCLATLPTAFVSRARVVFESQALIYIQMYCPCIQNIFVHTSIWLTVIMAVGRYAAICRPLQARYLVGVNATRVAVLLTFLIWTLLELPRFWSNNVMPFKCVDDNSGTTWYYVQDLGPFLKSPKMKITFDYLWSILGFFIPITILAYCNVHLIKALRASSRIRQLYRVHPRSTTHGSRITPTLVAIVCMFITLVSPSEFLHFYFFIIEGSNVEPFNMAIVVTNLLQSLNFSCNFVMYCLVNVHFRKTWMDIMYCKACRRPYRLVERRLTGTSLHNNIHSKGSFAAQSTFETVI